MNASVTGLVIPRTNGIGPFNDRPSMETLTVTEFHNVGSLNKKRSIVPLTVPNVRPFSDVPSIETLTVS